MDEGTTVPAGGAAPGVPNPPFRPRRSCGSPPRKLGKVRGVRCSNRCFNCNSAIGKLGDDPDTVRRAAAYLEGNSWKPTLVAQGVYQQPS
ncbi:endonuclease domain-containing protein [Streptomyces crystallinus]|uniref:endonuclease domain-containing protein n=1 Tax=Streptomyces crystallinus TaxID=68191 RepID=UPI003CD0B8A5